MSTTNPFSDMPASDTALELCETRKQLTAQIEKQNKQLRYLTYVNAVLAVVIAVWICLEITILWIVFGGR